MPEKIAVIGSRRYPDLGEVVEYVAGLPAGIEIVSGGASGVDVTAVNAAKTCGLPVRVFSADWNRYGKAAGMLRNRQIAEYADRAVAFWDGVSPGTAGCIALFRRAGKPVEVRHA